MLPTGLLQAVHQILIDDLGLIVKDEGGTQRHHNDQNEQEKAEHGAFILLKSMPDLTHGATLGILLGYKFFLSHNLTPYFTY